ncbi:M23 family metallopeptidase [Undibacterium sp. Ji42W]|uniref:M23 family metallopeptidase n=1 Tax=Undibacterium sp. Ji42W TaxID=3413039 RepID=UPI003BF120B7
MSARRLFFLLPFFLVAPLCLAEPIQARNDPVRIETVKGVSSNTLMATNTSRMPVTVTLQLSNFSNLTSSKPWPIQAQMAGGQTMELVEIAAANRQFGYTMDYRSYIVQGDPRARHDASISYQIPFVASQGFQVLQAADGPQFTHHTVATRYAVDIEMPMGTIVVAARAGQVVEVVSQFADDGRAEPAYMDLANYVRILHDDGSWADYFHLMQNSAHVQPGMRVEPGQVLALSGNSGYSATPHLHFHVQVNQNGTVISLPFHFINSHDGIFTPRYQSWLIPDTPNLNASKAKAKKAARECLPAGKALNDLAIRCLSSS